MRSIFRTLAHAMVASAVVLCATGTPAQTVADSPEL